MQTVYFFREHGRDEVKIGMSTDTYHSRLRSFKTYAANGAYVVGTIKTNNAMLIEREIHSDYSDSRMNGEFFLLTDAQVESIIRKYNPSLNQVLSEIESIATEKKISTKELIYTLWEHYDNHNYKKLDAGSEGYKVIELIYDYFIAKGIELIQISFSDLCEYICKNIPATVVKKTMRENFGAMSKPLHYNSPFTEDKATTSRVYTISIKEMEDILNS